MHTWIKNCPSGGVQEAGKFLKTYYWDIQGQSNTTILYKYNRIVIYRNSVRVYGIHSNTKYIIVDAIMSFLYIENVCVCSSSNNSSDSKQQP